MTNLHKEGGKKEILLDFVKVNNIDLSLSVGLGDSLHDLEVMNLTGVNIALNANNSLIKVAKEKGFEVANYADIIKKLSQTI